MAVLTKDEYFNRIHERLKEDSSDEGIKLLEDLTDTYTDLERKASQSAGEWEEKYNNLDATWRKRYQSRFYNGEVGNYEQPKSSQSESTDEYSPDDISINSLFEGGH